MIAASTTSAVGSGAGARASTTGLTWLVLQPERVLDAPARGALFGDMEKELQRTRCCAKAQFG